MSEEGITTNPEKTEALNSWPAPTSVTEVRSFVGFCSYYRKFIRNFSLIARPLSTLTSKTVKFRWTEECQEAFQELKNKLLSAPIMSFPNETGEFILDTDASDVKRYCVTRKELLATVFFINYYRHYLIGRHFLVRTDHKPLKWLFNLKDPSGQIARWLETLASFNFSMSHRAGKSHSNADGMSRHPCPPHACTCCEEVLLDCGPCKKCEKETCFVADEGCINKVTIELILIQSMLKIIRGCRSILKHS